MRATEKNEEQDRSKNHLKERFYCGTNAGSEQSRQFEFSFPLEILMAFQQSNDDELAALRNLEAAVRTCGLPTIMVSGQAQLDLLAAALKAVEDARRMATVARACAHSAHAD